MKETLTEINGCLLVLSFAAEASGSSIFRDNIVPSLLAAFYYAFVGSLHEFNYIKCVYLTWVTSEHFLFSSLLNP